MKKFSLFFLIGATLIYADIKENEFNLIPAYAKACDEGNEFVCYKILTEIGLDPYQPGQAVKDMVSVRSDAKKRAYDKLKSMCSSKNCDQAINLYFSVKPYITQKKYNDITDFCATLNLTNDLIDNYMNCLKSAPIDSWEKFQILDKECCTNAQFLGCNFMTCPGLNSTSQAAYNDCIKTADIKYCCEANGSKFISAFLSCLNGNQSYINRFNCCRSYNGNYQATYSEISKNTNVVDGNCIDHEYTGYDGCGKCFYGLAGQDPDEILSKARCNRECGNCSHSISNDQCKNYTRPTDVNVIGEADAGTGNFFRIPGIIWAGAENYGYTGKNAIYACHCENSNCHTVSAAKPPENWTRKYV